MFLRIFFITIIPLVVGCKVIDSETSPEAMLKFAEWKNRADDVRTGSIDQGKYKEARIAVNAWIEAKQTEITIAGGQWFTTVSLNSPEEKYMKVESTVSKVFPGESLLGIDDVIEGIIDAILGAYQENRIEQAQKANGLLDAYKWEAIK